MNWDGSGIETEHDESQLFTIPSADILRLILAHLMECGLHDSARALQRESGVGLAASMQPDAAWWHRHAATGQWALILQGLSWIDRARAHLDITLLAAVHEMTILELAELGEWEVAFALFRCVQRDEAMATSVSELSPPNALQSSITVSRSLEQKLAHIMAERQKNPQCPVPSDYYGDASDGTTAPRDRRQERREVLGRRLQEAVRIHPPKRLPTLLQQAVKWQSYTGQLPMVRQWWEVDDSHEDNGTSNKKRSRHGKRKQFDLVLGEVSVDAVAVGTRSDNVLSRISSSKDKPISQDYATIKFGKQANCEALTFLPDGLGLVSGSSDGLVEVWDMDGQLRNDLEYQRKDEVMGHDNGAAITALAVSNDTKLIASGAADGVVHIWRIDTGQCLRTLETSVGVSCLCFSPESSHVLVGSSDGICREFGLRTSRVLKEFRGHTSYLTACFYHLLSRTSLSSSDDDSHHLIVITASGDGSVRTWDGKTADALSVFKPITMGNRNLLSTEGSSIVTADLDRAHQTSSNEGSPALLSVLQLHTPPDTMILVPRASRAFLVDYSGRVLRLFQYETTSGTEPSVFVAATVNSTNRWLYLVKDDGSCCIFDVASGALERSIPDFAARSTASSEAKSVPEISHMSHHPNKGIIAAFSSSKGQKRGKVVLWK